MMALGGTQYFFSLKITYRDLRLLASTNMALFLLSQPTVAQTVHMCAAENRVPSDCYQQQAGSARSIISQQHRLIGTICIAAALHVF